MGSVFDLLPDFSEEFTAEVVGRSGVVAFTFRTIANATDMAHAKAKAWEFAKKAIESQPDPQIKANLKELDDDVRSRICWMMDTFVPKDFDMTLGDWAALACKAGFTFESLWVQWQSGQQGVKDSVISEAVGELKSDSQAVTVGTGGS